MNLKNPSVENMTFILNKLAELLDVANHGLLDPDHFDLSKYEDIKFMYEMIIKKGKLSPSETQAFIEELSSARISS